MGPAGAHLQQQPLVTEQGRLAVAAVPLARKRGKPQPVGRGKVDGLGAVQPGVEAAMVRPRECDHKLARLLQRHMSSDSRTARPADLHGNCT